MAEGGNVISCVCFYSGIGSYAADHRDYIASHQLSG